MSEQYHWSFLYAQCPYCDTEFFVHRQDFYGHNNIPKKQKIDIYCVSCGAKFPFFPEAAPKGNVELTEESIRMLKIQFKSRKEKKE